MWGKIEEPNPFGRKPVDDPKAIQQPRPISFTQQLSLIAILRYKEDECESKDAGSSDAPACTSTSDAPVSSRFSSSSDGSAERSYESDASEFFVSATSDTVYSFNKATIDDKHLSFPSSVSSGSSSVRGSMWMGPLVSDAMTGTSAEAATSDLERASESATRPAALEDTEVAAQLDVSDKANKYSSDQSELSDDDGYLADSEGDDLDDLENAAIEYKRAVRRVRDSGIWPPAAPEPHTLPPPSAFDESRRVRHRVIESSIWPPVAPEPHTLPPPSAFLEDREVRRLVIESSVWPPAAPEPHTLPPPSAFD